MAGISPFHCCALNLCKPLTLCDPFPETNPYTFSTIWFSLIAVLPRVEHQSNKQTLVTGYKYMTHKFIEFQLNKSQKKKITRQLKCKASTNTCSYRALLQCQHLSKHVKIMLWEVDYIKVPQKRICTLWLVSSHFLVIVYPEHSNNWGP